MSDVFESVGSVAYSENIGSSQSHLWRKADDPDRLPDFSTIWVHGNSNDEKAAQDLLVKFPESDSVRWLIKTLFSPRPIHSTNKESGA
jgi:hypothetical protein